jgi:hypothetical protein
MKKDLLIDIESYFKHKSFQYCFATAELLLCAQQFSNGGEYVSAMMARNLAAVAMAATLLDAKPFKDGLTNKSWKKDCYPNVQSNILKLQQIAGITDCEVLAERIRTTKEIVKGSPA